MSYDTSNGLQVLPSITRINSNSVIFANGKVEYFDAMILATGYRATTKEWLKVTGSVLFF